MAIGAGTMLALGGIGAAAAGAWSQIKAAGSLLGGLLVVRAEYLDYVSKEGVREYLKKEWRPLPGGLHYYETITFHPSGQKLIEVPFKFLPYETVFFKGWKFVAFTRRDSLWTLRGLVDLDELLASAIRNRQKENELAAQSRSRFGVLNVKGDGRFRGAAPSPMAASQGHSSQPAAKREYPSWGHRDRSFMYPNEEDYLPSGDSFASMRLQLEGEALAAVSAVRKWLSSKDWYTGRSIPWRIGLLFSGPGSTGKSSTAVAMALELGLPMYVFDLSTLTNEEFREKWGDMNAPCMAVMEDIDCVFDGRKNITKHESLSFDCLLNVLSGVSTKQGVCLVVTTNRPERIDDALGGDAGGGLSTRPGRIDRVVNFGPMSRENRARMAASILRDWPEAVEGVVEATEGLGAGQVQERCLNAAFERLA